MVRTIAFAALVILFSLQPVSAATIESCHGLQDGCSFKSKHGFVELLVKGPITKGDFDRLTSAYASAAWFECVNHYEPGRLAIVTQEEGKEKQEESKQAHPERREKSNNRIFEECRNKAIPERPASLNGRVHIGSLGGDLAEAIAIGRWIRQNRLGVVTYVECSSACIWILAAGLTRDSLLSTLRIHRPYFIAEDGISAGQKLAKLLQESKVYFSEMGVPPELAERMFSTPPDEAISLTREQISYYRLNQDDMGYQEESDLASAKRLGISRDELVARQQQLNEWNKRDPCPWVGESEKDRMHTYGRCKTSRMKSLGL